MDQGLQDKDLGAGWDHWFFQTHLEVVAEEVVQVLLDKILVQVAQVAQEH
jgi:hypothetical protein